LIAYQTAYLKTHYPVEFMAALLSSDIPGRNFKKKDSLVEHMDDSKRMGIEIVPPDVNSSDVDFSVSEGKINFALSAIKACGGGAAEAIVAARKNEGPFKDLFDFCERVDATSCNRSTIETLIRAGAMDSFNAKRSQLMAVLDRAMQSGAAALADRRSGQKSLFGEMEDDEDKPSVALPDIPELPRRECSLMEKEVLGFYQTGHPLEEYERKLSEFCSHTTADIAALPERAEVIMGGMLSAIKHAHIRKPRAGSTATRYANFDLEDKDGIIRCIAWPEEFLKFGELVQPDAVLVIRGAIDRRGGGDEANLVVNEVIPLDELDARYTSGMVVCIDESDGDSNTLKRLYEIVRGYPGGRDVFFQVKLNDGSRVRLKSNKVHADITPELRDRVDDLLGPGHLRLIISPPPLSNGRRNSARRNGATRTA
jgi:DNA polymerase-3 subunit alpha